jgi:hypothetical protein
MSKACLIAYSLLAFLSACGSNDELMLVEVRFATTTAAERAREVALIVYKMDDAEISPCRELIAGGTGEAIGLSREVDARNDVNSDGVRPVSIVFAVPLPAGRKVVYAEASDSNSAIYIRDCKHATAGNDEVVEIRLE